MDKSNELLARRWFEEIWNQRRTETIYELLAPNGIGHLETGDIVGPEQFHQVYQEFVTAFPDIALTIEEVVSEGESVVVRWKAAGTHKGIGFGLKASEKRAAFRGMTWMHIRDGKIVEGWDSWNQIGLFQELSIQP
jgi:steroid delta-isomerase-like uncharacterized protein